MKRGADFAGGTDKHRIVQCPKCHQQMKSHKLKQHIKTHNRSQECRFCKKIIRSDLLLRHIILCRDQIDETLCNREDCSLLESSLECSSVSGCFQKFKLNVRESKDYEELLSNTVSTASYLIRDLVSHHPIKVQVVLDLGFFHDSYEGREHAIKVFRSIMEPIILGDNLKKYLNRSSSYLKGQIEMYERNGSGWQFEGLNNAFLEASRYHPMAGSGKVNIPPTIKNMRSVLNVKAPDNKCFLYCILAKLYPVKKNAQRYTRYLTNIDAVKLDGLKFPIKIADIEKVETLNDLSISVFEWSVEDKSVIPIHQGCGVGRQIDLLYIRDEFTGHYLLIKNFNAFMRHRTKHHNSMYYCRRCLHGFTTADLLSEHAEHCHQGINQITKMPEPGTVIKFKATQKQDEKLFAVYFDFECLTVPVIDENRTNKTVRYQKHVPVSFCIVADSVFEDYEKEIVEFSCKDPTELVKKFLDELDRIYEKMMDCYETHQYSIDMTEKDEESFENSTNCHICGKDLDWESEYNYPVRDHDHSLKMNNFRGAAHNICNINYFNRTKKVPALCHNLKSYEMNIFVLELIKSYVKIDIIPENLEKFKAVFTEKFTFLDSYAFLSSSLDRLADDLKKSDETAFKRLKREFPKTYTDLMNKGIYFYDYASSFDVLEEQQIPSKDAFYNKLKDEGISDADYERAQRTFDNFECKNLRDYMELYVKSDALLLCDIFEYFRELCLKNYGLDPCNYLSLPGFTWDAMLKMTKVEIELISDLDQYTFVEDGLRGGVCTINHRHFAANNPYLNSFDGTKPTSFLHYVDANNLYGASMSKPLPTGNFRWLEKKQIDKLDICNLDADGDTCYVLEVDLNYPPEIHDRHNDYPLAVERKAVQENQLSNFNRHFLEKNGKKFLSSVKLCPDLTNKRNYTLSLRNLQLCISQGLQLVTIHRVLAADQSPFLKPYIDFNSRKRLESKTKFSSDLFKLCNNAIYGKCIEDIRKRTNVVAVKDEKKAHKLIAKPQYKGFRVLDEDVTLVQTLKKIVTLSKPILCGFTILENAKCIMGDFWYNVLKPKYGDSIKLILSDTDSFIYAVYTNDGYADLYGLREHMDLAGYSDSGPLAKFKDLTNKKVPGKFSDEKPTEVIKEVIALKPKMYSLLTQSLECFKEHDCSSFCLTNHSVTAKGISRAAQRNISHQDYKNVLEKSEVTSCVNRSIRSFNRELFTIEVKKQALSSFDDKKFILDNGVTTLSYGHYKLKDM